jgi:toxin ParE1/3/4
MTLPVRFHPTAQDELDQAADFYDLESPGLGSTFLNAVERALQQVRDHPESAPIILGSNRKKVVARFPFSVVYFVLEGTVVVLALAHQRRRPYYWRQRA